MKILWINNVADVLGGTLHATRDMLTALYDAEHTVALPLPANAQVQEFLGNSTTCVTHDDAQRGTWDVVVAQNTPARRIPKGDRLLVYYAHSAGAARPNEVDADLYLSVSNWLTKQLVLPADATLWQPVTVPKPVGKRDADVVTFGRLCTPTKDKWDEAGWKPYWDAAKQWADTRNTPAAWHMVGGPEATHKPSVEARGLLHQWDILLYATSHPESFGRVIREAQRCGCFPIVDGKGGTAEQITEPASGAVVRTPEELPAALDDWYGNMDARNPQKFGDEAGSLDTWRREFLARLKSVL